MRRLFMRRLFLVFGLVAFPLLLLTFTSEISRKQGFIIPTSDWNEMVRIVRKAEKIEIKSRQKEDICKKCQLIDTDLIGSDISPIGITDIPSWYECGQLCLKIPDCGSFTWINKTEECYLKTGVPSQSVNMETVSGIAACFNSITQGLKESVDKYKASPEEKLKEKMMAGVNKCLSNLNEEFFPTNSSKEKRRSKHDDSSKFDPSSANTMEIVGNIKVGQKVPDSSARHIMVVTTWRSGSTFLGDLLNHYKGVFYYYEPLLYYEMSYLNNKNPPQSEIEFIESLLKCRYDKDNIGYFHHISSDLLSLHNFRLRNSCHHLLPQEKMCLFPEYLNKVCPLYPIKLMKTVRLDLRETETLIKDPSLNLKILFLVRDPRGTYNSRSDTEISRWCEDRKQCVNLELGCEQMMDNINAAFDLETRYPGTIKLVRYEDLSMNPHDVVTDMMDFLDLPMIEELNNYIVTHTGAEKQKNNRYGTYRNSTARASAWRDKMSFDRIKEIQKACGAPMSKLGYRLLNNLEEAKNRNLKPLASNLKTIWPFELNQN